MSFDLLRWFADVSSPDFIWYAKYLTANGTLATGGHQVGLYIPKVVFGALFPTAASSRNLNPSHTFSAVVASEGREREVRAIWYNNRVLGQALAMSAGLHAGAGRTSATGPSVRGSSAKYKWEKLLCPCTYRPFDVRYTVLHRSVVSNPRTQVMSQFVRPNVGICVGRQGQAIPGKWGIVFASRYPADQNLFYRGGNTTFPLYWYHQATSLGLDSGKRHNLSARFLAGLAGRLSLARIPTTGLPVGVDAEDVVHYVYSVLHSASYRSRYEEFTKVDFPRIPLPGGHDLFRLLTDLGGELVGLHLLESPRLDVFCTTYTGQKSPEVGRVGWVDDTVWLDAPAKTKGKPTAPGTIGFCGVPEAVWKFEIGGYQVCEKWLKDRKGRKLLKADIDHYQKTVVALAETIRIMKEIDEVIEAHGGWPGAFQGAATTPAVSELPFRKVAEPRKHPYEQGEPE